MKLLLFLSGACFGTVLGILVGHLTMADELRERTQLQDAARSHTSTARTANPHAHPQGTPGRQPPEVAKMIKQLSDHVEANPTDPQGWIRLGQFYARALKWEKVIGFYGQALKLKPGDPEILLQLAGAHLGKHDHAKALELLRAVLSKHPTNERAGIGLAQLLTQLGRVQDALDVLNQLDQVVTDKDVKERIKTQRAVIESKKK